MKSLLQIKHEQKRRNKKISCFEWEIPREGKMNVPCRIFAR
jgi:hypothetical protein